jgi:hypothetical protein
MPSMKVLGPAKTVTFCVQAQGSTDSCDAVTNATVAAAATASDSSAKKVRTFIFGYTDSVQTHFT